jgi:hypothetical protein
VTFNIVWKLVRGDGGLRHDCPISTPSSSSPPIRLVARRINAADQPATGEWGPAMRLETPHWSVSVWLCAR